VRRLTELPVYARQLVAHLRLPPEPDSAAGL
jgi:hypothetical protein